MNRLNTFEAYGTAALKTQAMDERPESFHYGVNRQAKNL